MTDVREASAPANTNDAAPQGDFIWYELMTPDPDGSKAFTMPWSAGTSAPKGRPNMPATA